jgi:histidine triad (HIT) family protein
MSRRVDGCVFCGIVAGTEPATIRGETRDSIAIDPLGPVAADHLLFIPREHVPDAGSVPEVTARVARDAAAWARRRGVAFNLITSAGAAATQSVWHLHWHYVPRHPDDQLMVPWGTLHGENPQDPHRCKGMRELERQLAEVRR